MLLNLKNNKGFTLIELLTVVAIIALLATIAITQYSRYVKKGYAAAVRSDVMNTHGAVKAWFADDSGRTISLASTTTGPGPLQNYPGVSVSSGVTIAINAASSDTVTITGSHSQLTGGASYIITGNGSVTDTLAGD